ncbi:peptidase inhibitor family I36 protein [Streptomyces sp. NPDC057939]|uniref:peptidase inhibitor family I36 protein n=1 Tax=Streptomyces sp. NPDC057939 TaxID=3346284 RepID=UPI0036E804CC
MRKRLALAAAGAAMLLAATAGTASAQTPPDGSTDTPTVIHPIKVSTPYSPTDWQNCLHNQACVWQSSNGTGLLWVVPGTGKFKLSNHDINNKISAVWNRSPYRLTLFDYDNSKDGYLDEYSPYGPISNVPQVRNDKASSLTLY